MLTEEERGQVETRLLEERERTLEALAEFDETRDQSFLDESGEMSLYRFHMADIGTEAMEREKQFLFASRDGERLYAIDEALRRLYREPESFGACENCGRAIGLERLLVLPSTPLCAECARTGEEN